MCGNQFNLTPPYALKQKLPLQYETVQLFIVAVLS